MAGIKQEVIDEILMRTDIQEYISSYVSLKRAGTNYKGLCPFHSEKSPSFTVYPSTNSFFCFGCGIGGDAVTFTKEIEHLDYPDAIEFLAKRAGVTVLRDGPTPVPSQQTRGVTRERMWAINKDAATFFNKQLFQDNPKSREALAYFTQKRGLSQGMIRHFGLGFAPDDFSIFSNHMLSLGYTYDELVAAFLCGKSENGRYYDAFRNRVMFPIIDVSGNVIAFGGRAMDNETKPKYKNTSDTSAFKKSRNLFALNFARHHSKETIILCEGYMDVIALHAAGFENAVATLGTAITDEQARLLSKYTKKVIICYDSDEAGQKAANRALGIIGSVGLEVRIITIPGAKDPDEYIKTNGPDSFKSVIEDAKTRFDYIFDGILSRYDINIPANVVKVLGEIENVISGYYSVAEREVYCQIVAKKLNLMTKNIIADVDRLRQKRDFSARKKDSEVARRTLAGYGDKTNPDYAKAPTTSAHEEFVIAMMLLYPEHRKFVFENDELCEEDFFTELGKRIFRYIKECYYDSDTFKDLNACFDTAEVSRITSIKIKRMSLDDNGEEAFKEGIKSLKSSKRKKESEYVSTLEGLSDLISKLRGKPEDN